MRELECQIFGLCPTRELAAQVAENFDTYAKKLKVNWALLIGGVSLRNKIRSLIKALMC